MSKHGQGFKDETMDFTLNNYNTVSGKKNKKTVTTTKKRRDRASRKREEPSQDFPPSPIKKTNQAKSHQKMRNTGRKRNYLKKSNERGSVRTSQVARGY